MSFENYEFDFWNDSLTLKSLESASLSLPEDHQLPSESINPQASFKNEVISLLKVDENVNDSNFTPVTNVQEKTLLQTELTSKESNFQLKQPHLLERVTTDTFQEHDKMMEEDMFAATVRDHKKYLQVKRNRCSSKIQKMFRNCKARVELEKRVTVRKHIIVRAKNKLRHFSKLALTFHNLRKKKRTENFLLQKEDYLASTLNKMRLAQEMNEYKLMTLEDRNMKRAIAIQRRNTLINQESMLEENQAAIAYTKYLLTQSRRSQSALSKEDNRGHYCISIEKAISRKEHVKMQFEDVSSQLLEQYFRGIKLHITNNTVRTRDIWVEINLENLSLSENSSILKSIKVESETLPIRFNASNNCFRNITSNILHITWKNLITLHLRNNKLRNINFRNLGRNSPLLLKLDLSNNYLVDIRQMRFMLLLSLKLENNLLEDYLCRETTFLPRLRALNLQDNNISYLPEIVDLTRIHPVLEYMNFVNNPGTNLIHSQLSFSIQTEEFTEPNKFQNKRSKSIWHLMQSQSSSLSIDYLCREQRRYMKLHSFKSYSQTITIAQAHWRGYAIRKKYKQIYQTLPKLIEPLKSKRKIKRDKDNKERDMFDELEIDQVERLPLVASRENFSSDILFKTATSNDDATYTNSTQPSTFKHENNKKVGHTSISDTHNRTKRRKWYRKAKSRLPNI